MKLMEKGAGSTLDKVKYSISNEYTQDTFNDFHIKKSKNWSIFMPSNNYHSLQTEKWHSMVTSLNIDDIKPTTYFYHIPERPI